MALSGTTNRSAAGWLGRNGSGTRVYADGLFQSPKSSVDQRLGRIRVEVADDRELRVARAVELRMESA